MTKPKQTALNYINQNKRHLTMTKPKHTALNYKQ